MATLLITGGAGFIGSNLVHHALAHTGDRLIVVDKLTYAGSLLNLEGPLKDPRVTFVRGDIADREATPYAPNSPYAASKASADHLVRAYSHTYGLPVLITNCSNNYGPFQFPEKLIPLMVLNAVDGRPLPIYGDGGNVRDWLHVDDHCAGLLLVLRQGRPGEKYNIGGGNERTNLELVDRVCDILDAVKPAAPSRRALKTFVPDRPGHDRRYAIDATKIRRELGWAPRHTFEDGLEATVRWYLDHRG